MSESLDQLAKNLASGMSRRKAIWQFITSLGVVAAFTGRKAYAVPSGGCAEFCEAQTLIFHDLCLEASARCRPGYCAEFTLIRVNGQAPYSCVPVFRINSAG